MFFREAFHQFVRNKDGYIRAAEDVRDGRGLRRVQQGGDRGLHGRGEQGELLSAAKNSENVNCEIQY